MGRRGDAAGLGLWAGFFGPIQVLLAQQAQLVSPGHKELVFGVVTGVGSAVSVVANPLFGALSDRTVSRFGRRVPWVATGALLGALALALLATADSLLAMVLAWSLAQASLNAMFAALTATVPDLVPVRERGVVGGWVAVSQTLGIVAGVGIATATGGVAAGYYATAAAVVVLAVPYVLGSRDVPLPRSLRPALSLREFAGSFWLSPRRHPDFAWAWLTRFLVNLGNSLGTLLLYFYLQDAVALPGPGGRRPGAHRGLRGLHRREHGGVRAVVGPGPAPQGLRHRLRDGHRTRRADPGAGADLAGALAGAVVFGIGYGVYLSVDFALCTEVLPTAHARAKDLGVINIAVALPQVFAPFLGTFLVANAGGYVTLYAVATGVCLLGSVFVRNIHGVR